MAQVMEELDSWRTLIGDRTDPMDGLYVEMPLQPSPDGGSGTFLAVASDGQRWWVKPPNQLQGGKVLVTEYVVGMLGQLLDAPTCPVALIEIPEEIEGWAFRPGCVLTPGFGNASLAVRDATESRILDHRNRDDNRRRHAGIFALHDWCWGGDPQWLYCESAHRQIYSHDHGWYFPETGPDWSETSLLAHLDEPHQAPYSTRDLDPEELTRLSDRLTSITTSELACILNSVPVSWPVTDPDLACLGVFLMRRALDVALRLGALA